MPNLSLLGGYRNSSSSTSLNIWLADSIERLKETPAESNQCHTDVLSSKCINGKEPPPAQSRIAAIFVSNKQRVIGTVFS